LTLFQLYCQLRYRRPGLFKHVGRLENVKLRGAAALVFCFCDAESLFLFSNIGARDCD
jgi:hypothetical protein